MNRTARGMWMAVVLAAAGLSLLSTPARAQITPGVQAGVSGDPGQFYFGGHVETEPVADQLRFRPGVEIGVGSDITVVALNFNFAYHFRQRRQPWHAYVGAGPALNIVDRPRGTDAGGGFTILVGAAHREGLFAEFKVGMMDSPNVKFGVGYAFR